MTISRWGQFGVLDLKTYACGSWFSKFKVLDFFFLRWVIYLTIVLCSKFFCVNIVIEMYSIVQNLSIKPNQMGKPKSTIVLRLFRRSNSTNTSTQCTWKVWIMHRSWLLKSDSTKWSIYIHTSLHSWAL